MDQEPNQAPQVPQELVASKKPFNKLLALSIGLGVVIVALVVVVLFLWSKNNNAPEAVVDNTNNPIKVIHDPNQLTPVSTSTPVRPAPKPGETFVRVEWYAEAIKTTLPGEQSSDQQGGITRYKVGKIAEGKYSGKELYLEQIPGLGTEYVHYILENESPVDLSTEDIKIYGIDDLPEAFALPGSNYTLKKGWVTAKMYSEIKKVWKVFTITGLGDFYLTDDGCFVVELPDHTAITYDFNIPFVNYDTRALEVTFKDGSINQDPYTYTRITGCGAMCMYLAVVDENKLKPQERIVEAGKTSNGEPVYSYIDTNAPELKNLYNDRNTVPYNNSSGSYDKLPDSKYSYSEFLKYHPLLYWKDPIGRWVEIKNDRFQIAAEMCKPVIYLYPQKETELSVRVAPNGGFTYTNPPYNGGWRVLAYPNGIVKDLSTDKTYPYLFWEGIGLNYPQQETGFVVKAQDLNSFLSQKVSLLGLKGREATDFLDYWVPRLQGLNQPYIKISFLKKEQMDEIAPLELSVKPNSVIRVMMTAKGLDSFEQLPQQELPVPQERSGFSFVEWGGVVLK